MTIITLPPDLESRLADEASRRGTTPELLALDGLRRLFAPQLDGPAPAETLFDFLAGHIAVGVQRPRPGPGATESFRGSGARLGPRRPVES
jgi:hypothetical protein